MTTREDKLKTSERIAKEIGKSEKHVRRAEQYAQALDPADSVCPGIKKDILSGFINTTNKDVIALLKADKEDLPDMIDELRGIKKKEDEEDRPPIEDKAVRSFMEMKTLNPVILRELIEKIEVHQIEGTGKNRTQRVIIHYRFVGCLQIPEWHRKRKVTLESRQGVAVNYLPTTA